MGSFYTSAGRTALRRLMVHLFSDGGDAAGSSDRVTDLLSIVARPSKTCTILARSLKT